MYPRLLMEFTLNLEAVNCRLIADCRSPVNEVNTKPVFAIIFQKHYLSFFTKFLSV